MEHPEDQKALLLRMGVESFRHVTKDKLVDLVDGLPTLDPQVALQVLAQVPQLAKMASEVLADHAGAHQDTLQANADNGARLHERRLLYQQALIELLARHDVSDEVLLKVLTNLHDFDERDRQVDATEKRWLSDLFETRMKGALLVAGGLALVVFTAAQPGGKPVSALSRLLSSKTPM